MGTEIIILLIILVVTVILFSIEWFPVDVTALGLIVVLILTGMLTPAEAFSGFGSEVVIMMLGLLIMATATERTGVTQFLAQYLVRWSGNTLNQVLIVVMALTVAVGSFMSNTAATALFLPIVIGLARRLRISQAKLLMPLAFASILSSSITLIGTSTNIVVSGLMQRYGMEPLGMFELTPAGLPIALAGIAYMYFIGRHLIPDRTGAEQAEGNATGRPRIYLSELHILPGSPFAGKTLAEAALGRDLDLTVLRVVRDKIQYYAPVATLRLQEGDELLVNGMREDILRAQDIPGVELAPERKLEAEEPQEDLRLHEIILLPGSPLLNRTLRGSQFRHRYGLQVLAQYRHGEPLMQRLSEVRLRMGDVLLVQGEESRIDALEQEGVFSVLGAVDFEQFDVRRAPLAAGIFGLAIALTALEILPIAVAMLLGAVLMLLTRCITPEEAYRHMQWRVIILIAGMLTLGTAIETTGTAEFLAGQVVGLLGNASPFWLLTAFFALTVVLTQPMSNQSAAVVVLPIAVQTALQLGLNPRSFAIIIALAASTSFITPLEPACLMVYGPGRYRFFDFVKVGSLLTIIVYAIAIASVMMLWPVSGG